MFLKFFFYLLNNNYKDFLNYHYPNHQMSFFEEFKEKFIQKKESILNYYLLPNGEEYKKFKKNQKFLNHTDLMISIIQLKNLNLL